MTRRLHPTQDSLGQGWGAEGRPPPAASLRGHVAQDSPAPPAPSPTPEQPARARGSSRRRAPPESPPNAAILARARRVWPRNGDRRVTSSPDSDAAVLPRRRPPKRPRPPQTQRGARPAVTATPSSSPRMGPPPPSSSSSPPTFSSSYHHSEPVRCPGRDPRCPPSSSPLCAGVWRLRPCQMFLQLHIWEQSAPRKEHHSLALSFC